jgi:predicted permease
MSNFIMLAACLLAGLLLRWSGRVPEQAPAAINGVILHVSLPALTLCYLHRIDFASGAAVAVLMPWLLFGLGAAVFWLSGRALGLAPASIGALTLVGGFGNTSFVGLPMIESLYGKAGLPLGLLIDQLGSYLALSTVGVLAVTVYAGQRCKSAWQVCRQVATFPPFIAIVLALLLLPVTLPGPLVQALGRIGDTLAPLALLSVGLQLRFGAWRQHAPALSLGLGFKLLVCPALAVAALLASHAGSGMSSHVMVIESAMPPMIGAGIVATQAKLDPSLVSLMIGIGIPLAFFTVPAWSWLFGFVVSGV